MGKGIKVEETLAANRRCRQFGFVPAFAFMVGYPTETFEDINKTIDLMFRLKQENPQVQLQALATYTAIPGTPSYALAIEHGLKPPSTLEGWVEWVFDDYDFQGARIPWFDRRERIAIGNLAFLGILSDVFANIMGSMKNPLIRMGGRSWQSPRAATFNGVCGINITSLCPSSASCGVCGDRASARQSPSPNRLR